jgi:hypothetical protein
MPCVTLLGFGGRIDRDKLAGTKTMHEVQLKPLFELREKDIHTMVGYRVRERPEHLQS